MIGKRLTTNEFVERSKKIHGDKYDYSKVKYINNKTKVCIICSEHGEFWQTPSDNLNGCGCPMCGTAKLRNKFSLTLENFIEKARKVHGDKYDYSKVEYVNNHTKVCIIHKKCGNEFWQTPNSHLNGHGCSYCRGNEISQSKKSNNEIFIKKAQQIHGNCYDYSKVKYISAKTPIKILCNKHGVFEQTPDKHLYGRGCPKCGKQISYAEDKIRDYIGKFNKYIIKTRVKNIISPYELDIYIPEKKVAIEYDGLIWHSEKFGKDKNYHLNKTELCEKQGIRLIHIFEDEWLEHEDIVKSKLRHILGCDVDLPKIFARKCIVNEIDNQIAESFLEKNHIQGFARSTIYLGCFYNNELVGVMSFKRETSSSNKWELTRFATDITKHCVGVGGKLFKYFVKKYNPSEVKSFADRRWSTTLKENLYDKLGFMVDNVLKPDYHYVVGDNRLHKFGFRKQILLKKYPSNGLTEDMTEHEMCQKLGFYRIYDCGLIKYIWKK